jgi:hypothetical protein
MSNSAKLLVFLHCKLEHLDCPWDLRHLVGAIISMIQFYKAWTALITPQVDVSEHKSAAARCLRRARLRFRHCELKPLDCPWDLHHLAGTIISTIQFYKAWTALIALQFDVSDCK